MRTLYVLGMGPAGALAALRATHRGYSVVAVDPAAGCNGALPEWPATYGVISPEVPQWCQPWMHPPSALTARTDQAHQLAFRYQLLNKAALRRAVWDAGIRVQPQMPPELVGIADLAPQVGAQPSTPRTPHPVAPGVQDLPHPARALVVDCRGAVLDGSELWQLAVGYVITTRDAEAAGLEPTFMDWSDPPHHPPSAPGVPPIPAAQREPASFLYVQPLSDGWLLEETVLATAAPTAGRREEICRILEQRLQRALATRGLPDTPLHPGVLHREVVAIPMGTRAGSFRRPTVSYGVTIYRFGARGGLIHPATGYSVGAAMGAVDCLLDAIASNGVGACAGSRRQLISSEVAFFLRRVGAQLIARASQETLRSFFAGFFDLPESRQLGYLSGDSGLGVLAAMWALRRPTGLRHPFLRPLWRRPLSVAVAAAGPVVRTGQRRLRPGGG